MIHHTPSKIKVLVEGIMILRFFPLIHGGESDLNVPLLGLIQDLNTVVKL